MDRAAEDWIRAHVEPVGVIETAHERPWATVLRVPLSNGVAWFKAALRCRHSSRGSRLSCSHAGPTGSPSYSATRRSGGGFSSPTRAGRSASSATRPRHGLLPCRCTPSSNAARPHTSTTTSAHGVPDLRVATLPARYEDLLQRDLPLERDEIRRLREFAPRFAELCDELAAHDLPETVQHDDLHMGNLYLRGQRLRLLDWGDASISHPFASLVVTFRFLEEITKLSPGDPWFARLRDAYLEPWGGGLVTAFALAIRIGTFAHSIAWARQRAHLPEEARAEFDRWFSVVLRRALAQTLQ